MELVKPSRVICMLYAETAHMEFHSAKKKKNIWLALVTRHSNISKILLCFRKGSLYIFSLSRSKDRGAHWHKNTGSGKYSLSHDKNILKCCFCRQQSRDEMRTCFPPPINS